MVSLTVIRTPQGNTREDCSPAIVQANPHQRVWRLIALDSWRMNKQPGRHSEGHRTPTCTVAWIHILGHTHPHAEFECRTLLFLPGSICTLQLARKFQPRYQQCNQWFCFSIYIGYFRDTLILWNHIINNKRYDFRGDLTVKFFSKLNYLIFGFFDPTNNFFDNKNKYFLGWPKQYFG